MAPITRFPDPTETGPEGVVAVGGDLHPESLKLAYQMGIFPWPMTGYPLVWFCPEERGILEFDRLHIPRSLALARKKAPYRLSIDENFEGVIRACARVPRPGQSGTWITPEMVQAYLRFHQEGFAHSIEAWEGPELVGGIYGVCVDGVFAGESMFHLKPNASKLALLHLIEHLQATGLEWIDIQMVTPHMEALGARLIPRPEFLTRLAQARARGLRPF